MLARVSAEMSATGMDRRTGKVLTGWPHVVQSIEDILTTRVMTRIMRRDYGSNVPKLVDAPMNQGSLLRLYVAIADALEQWEPRFRLTHISFTATGADGVAEITLAGVYYPRGHLGDFTPEAGNERSVALITLNEAGLVIHS